MDVSGSTQRLTYRHLPSADGALIVSLIAGTTIHLHGGVFTADGTTGASGGTEHFVEGTWDTEPTFSDGVSYRALITQARPGARGPAGAGADIDVEVNGTSISTAASEINFTGPVSGSKAPGTEDVTLHLADPADYGIPKVARIPSAFGGEILHLEHDYAEGTQQDITITVGFSGGFAGFDADALYGDYGSISVDENNTPVAALVGTGTAASYNITRVAGATHWIDLLDRVSIAGTEHLLGDAYFLNGERTRDLATPPVNLTAATLTFNARYDADWYWTDGTEPVLAGLWSWDEELTPNAYKRGGGIEVQKDGTIVDPDSRGLDFRGPSVSVQQESGVSEVHVADANHLAIKKVAVIPPAFDETVLYLPHNYTEGVKQDVTVTVGFGNGFAGYDTSIVGRFGSLSVGSVPFRGLIGQGDATGYSIDRVGGDQHWMYALTSVEINGTVHQLGDPYYIGGTLVRNILSPPTGLTGATFGFNAQLMPGFWYFTDGSTERVSAGLWEWDTDQTQYNRLTAGGARNLGNLVVDNQGGTAFDLGETLRPGATYGFLIRPSAANFAAAYAECPGIVIQSLAIQTTAPSTAVGAIGLKVTWDDDAPEDFSHANLFVWYGGANTIYLAYGRGGTISRTVDVYRMN